MASSQGMCKNCGSLIMFDDRDSTCECVFCHCVFPSSEAIEILTNPEGRTFANEKFESNNDDRHHYTTRVYSTESLEKQIQREELKKSQKTETKKENEYEVTAKDVKAPTKLVVSLISSAVVIVLIILAISFPAYNSRKKITESLEQNVTKIYSGDRAGYSFYGQNCQNFNLVTNDIVDEDEAKTIFDNYCEQLSQAGRDKKDDVTVTIYCNGGIYTVTDTETTFQADENN